MPEPSAQGLQRMHVLPRRGHVAEALIVAAVFLEAVAVCAIPLTAGYVVNHILSGDVSSFAIALGIASLAYALALLAGLLRDFRYAAFQSEALGRLRQSMFERLQQLSMLFHSQAKKDEVLDRFTTELSDIETAFATAISWGLLPAMEALLCSLLMLALQWRVGIAVILFWVWILLAPRATAARARRVSKEFAEQEASVIGAVEESLHAQSVIRAFSLEHMGTSAFRRRNDALAKGERQASLLTAFTSRLTASGVRLLQIFVLGLSAWLVLQRLETVGQLVALQVLSLMLGNSLVMVSEFLPLFENARRAFNSILFTLREVAPLHDAKEAKTLLPLSGEIQFSGVSFSYDPPSAALDQVTLRVPRGTYAAFVGPSGSGKSTMLKLLLRFFDPQTGHVAIDGHQIKGVTQKSLRAQIGVVLQENFVFHASVRDNIRLGRQDASDEAIVAAAKEAGLFDYIQSLPGGLETMLGGNALQLSGEMTQRLAIARAVLRDPAILLLDEVASALDAAEEVAVNATIREIAKGRTLISVTHRLSSAADADAIFVFDQGRVVEQGNHFELLAAGGVYAGLWKKQAGFRFSADGRHVDVDAQRLKALPVLEKLDESILAELAPFFATETFPAHREIVRQSDPGDKFYIIVRGKVEVWRTEEISGRTLRVAVLQDGDFFGEITLITGFPRTATVRTASVCTCLSLERGQFNRLLERFPDLRREMSEVAVQRLRDSGRAALAAI